ncbi:unnamed protein product [Urochloa decumbens]|uniref:F-box domain-containing protein n=1 Tax=Urochloa decumbens TaxID=240449 RepID=A0ABC8WCQ0_9POAL
MMMEVDFLSQLPSDVLISILEKMDLRDAIRAGVLSRRWRRLSSQLPRLVLGYEDFLPKDPCTHIYYNEDDDDSGKEEGRPYDAFWEASDKMLRVAMALLASRPSAAAAAPDDLIPGCTLSMSFLLRHNYKSVGRLLDDAVASGKVRHLELQISTTYWLYESDDDETYTATLRAMLRYGRPRLRTLLDSCPAVFGGLTRFALEYTRLLNPDELTEILNACPKLEALSLVFAGSVSRGKCPWSVRHARLSDVSFTCCNFYPGLNLAWLPRLERCTFEEWNYYGAAAEQNQPLTFGHVPCLQTLTMSNTLRHDERVVVLSQILANTAVADLCLDFNGRDIWVKPETPKRFNNIFGNLQHLKIHNVHQECGLTWTMFLLQAAPSLKELCIKPWDHECEMSNYTPTTIKKKNVAWEVAADFKHYNLTQLTILGFYSTGEAIVAYLQYLAQAAVNLQEIHMYENEPCDECSDTPAGIGTTRIPQTEKDKDPLRESISLISRGDDEPSMRIKIFMYSSSNRHSSGTHS